jgi:hypothetical protein
MTDPALLDDLIAKLHEMQEQLSMAHLEAAQQSLLASRIRHLTILAQYVRSRLEAVKESGVEILAQPASAVRRIER